MFYRSFVVRLEFSSTTSRWQRYYGWSFVLTSSIRKWQNNEGRASGEHWVRTRYGPNWSAPSLAFISSGGEWVSLLLPSRPPSMSSTTPQAGIVFLSSLLSSAQSLFPRPFYSAWCSDLHSQLTAFSLRLHRTLLSKLRFLQFLTNFQLLFIFVKSHDD